MNLGENELPLILLVYHRRWHNRGLIDGLHKGLRKRARRGTLPFAIEYLVVSGYINHGLDPVLDEQIKTHFESRLNSTKPMYDLILTPGHFILSPAIQKHYTGKIIGCTAFKETITEDTFEENDKIYFATYKGSMTTTSKDYFIADVMRLLEGE